MTIGSIVTMPTNGRPGIVVGSTSLGETGAGRERVRLIVRQRLPDGTAGAAGVPAPPQTVAAGRAAPVCAPCESERDRPPAAYEVREPVVSRDPAELTAEERAEVDRLRQRDSQVKQEEKAHAGAAGSAAGPINYIYETGPDGRQYAVAGSVSVRVTNPSGDPQRLASAANRMAAAAHAAHNPSAADLAAAANGYRLAAEAAAETRRLPGQTTDLES